MIKPYLCCIEADTEYPASVSTDKIRHQRTSLSIPDLDTLAISLPYLDTPTQNTP